MTIIHFPIGRQDKSTPAANNNRRSTKVRLDKSVNLADEHFKHCLVRFDEAVREYAVHLTSNSTHYPDCDGEQITLTDDDDIPRLYNCAEAFRILMQPLSNWLEHEVSSYCKRKRLKKNTRDKWYCAALYVIYCYNDICSMIRANARRYRYDLQIDPDCSVIRSNTYETFSLLEMALG